MALAHICDTDLITKIRLELGKEVANARLIEDLNHISIKLNDSIIDCNWRKNNKSCSDMFRPILTEDGVCFTFNSLNSQEIYSKE